MPRVFRDRRRLSDSAIVQAMLDFQAGLARAKAAVGVLPASAASTIVRSCKAEIFDITSAMPHSAIRSQR